jgi:proline iminopeptidase
MATLYYWLEMVGRLPCSLHQQRGLMSKWQYLSGAVLAVLFSATSQASANSSDRSFESSGLLLHYEVSGQGTPVVVLAGGPGFGAIYMQPVVDMIAKDHTVILLEQRGTGRSLPAQETPETINEDLVVSDIEALRHKLGYSRWTLLGHSFGTFTAMKYAIAHPEHVRAMVLLAVMPPRQADDHMDANLQARLPASAGPAFHALMVKSRAATTDAERNQLSEQMNEIVLPAYLYDPSKMGDVIALSKAAGMNATTGHLIQQSVGNYDLTKELSTISAPTLIVQGVADPLDPSIAAKTQAAIPNAKLSVLQSCGHFAWIEAPDKLSPLLSKFLADR